MQVYLQLIYESARFATQALWAHKMRTFLSLLGVTIGIFSIVSVYTMVDSLERNIRGSVESLGNNVIFIQKWPWAFGSDYPWWKYIQRPLPTHEELEMLRTRLQVASACTFAAGRSATASFRENRFEDITLLAVARDYERVSKINLREGRYFTPAEIDGGRALCLLGSDVAMVLFGGGEAVGKQIEVAGQKMTVVGVLTPEGESVVGDSPDQQVFIPAQFARKFTDLRSEKLNPFIMVKAKPGISNIELKDDIRRNLRAIRKQKPAAEDNFALNESSVLEFGLKQLFSMLNIVGTVIGLFALLVGGFGIANIMFVSVKERTAIIGIQKALGARRSFILLQFLTEAVTLCLLGGIIGLLLIRLGAWMIDMLLDFGIVLSWGNIGTGLLLSVAIGVLAGLVPAWQAAKLHPVEAMRSAM